MRRTTITLVAVTAAAALAGCGPGRPATPGPVAPAPQTAVTAAPVPAPAPAAPTDLVMIIRHGEKPDEETAGAARGIDVNGVEDESSLTRVGWDRARALVGLFDPAGPARPGLARPAAIYAAGATDEGEGKRTRETVAPLADKLGLTVDTRYGKGDEEKLVEHVLAQPGPTLISWQHGEIPTIAKDFPGLTPAPPSEWPDERFDVVWVFTRTAGGWHFTQVPEQVLPQDLASVIQEEDD